MPQIVQNHITDVPFIGPDPRTRTHILPTRVIWTQGNVRGASTLLAGGVHEPCIVESTPEQQASLVLDFGKELNGGIAINLGYFKSGENVRVRVRFGESVSETMGQPNQHHGIHDWNLSLPPISVQEIGLTGFRFVRIDLLDAPQSFELRGVTAVALERPIEALGSFECSDEKLNRIWEVGRRTVHLCMQNYMLDGIKRDRMVWMGDIHSQIGVIQNVYGGQKIVQESLDILRDRTPFDAWMNGIPAYSVWWIKSQHDWFMYTGNMAYLKSQHTFFSALTRRLAGMVTDAGRLDWKGRALLDWASARDEAATDTGLQSLGLLGFQSAETLAKHLHDAELATICAAAIRKMMKAELPPTKNKQATAMRVLAGQRDAVTANREILAHEPAVGLSPWFGLYVLQARAAAGDAVGAQDLLKTYWGGMIDLGATSYWEQFDVEWLTFGSRIDELPPAGKKDVHADIGDHCYVGLRHSLCHGWGSGATTYLSEHVLGVQPATPGYGQVRIKPLLGNLQWARGAVPTPHGLIRVRHSRKSDGSIHSDIDLPKGCEQVA